MIDILPNPTLLAGLDGQVIYVSRKSTLFNKIKIGTPLSNLVHADDCDPLQRLLFDLRKCESAQLEARLNVSLGPENYAQINIKRYDQNGEHLLIVQLTDITDLKRREIDIRHRERLWNDALTTSRSGVWDINLSKGTVFCSDTWRELRGLPTGFEIDVSVYDWVRYVHPDDRAMVIHCVERQNHGDPDYNCFTYRIQHSAGHWVWIESRGSCIERDEHGEPFRIAGIDSDVTAAMNDKRELERVSLRLKLALDVSQMGVFEANFRTGITNWDRRTYEIFEIDPSTQITMNGLWEAMIHPDDLDTAIRQLDEHNQRMEPYSCEYRALLHSGREIYVRARTIPFVDNDGAKKLIGTAMDITADVTLRKELEHSKSLVEAHNAELVEARISIEHNALHDYLTNLPNRRYLDQQLAQMAERCKSDNLGLAILHIDLDRFKEINDTLGHHMGDVMLQHTANILREHRRDDEFVARIGGDEFVLVAHVKNSKRRLTALADRLIDALRRPVNHDGHECRFGASVGIAMSDASNIDYKQLLLNADIALYNAKKRGRNRFEFFTEAKQDSMITTKRVSDEILLALERDEFVPYYQLQFDARTLNITGVETLARWHHPNEGILSPDRFLAIADDLDVISNIDALILEKALKHLRLWKSLGLPIPYVSVNVSARRLYDPNLLGSLKKLDIQPGEASFELLESIFLDGNDDIVQHNLRGLRKMNIGIEVDDFGTGHASIVSLLKVAPSTLKVDRALIHHASGAAEQKKLLSAIIEMGHSLGITVLGEGVETMEQISTLQELGCDRLQGFALCKPMPSDELISYIRNEEWRRHIVIKSKQQRLNLAS